MQEKNVNVEVQEEEQLIEQARIRREKLQKLISEGKQATEAARLVGYDNYANFYKLYKKLFGASPTQRENKRFL